MQFLACQKNTIKEDSNDKLVSWNGIIEINVYQTSILLGFRLLSLFTLFLALLLSFALAFPLLTTFALAVDLFPSSFLGPVSFLSASFAKSWR